MDSALLLLPVVAVVVSALAVAGAVRRRVLAWEWAVGCYLATALLLVILRSMGSVPDVPVELWIIVWATFSPLIALRGAGWTVEREP
jgi:hypothetical protein